MVKTDFFFYIAQGDLFSGDHLHATSANHGGLVCRPSLRRLRVRGRFSVRSPSHLPPHDAVRSPSAKNWGICRSFLGAGGVADDQQPCPRYDSSPIPSRSLP